MGNLYNRGKRQKPHELSLSKRHTGMYNHPPTHSLLPLLLHPPTNDLQQLIRTASFSSTHSNPPTHPPTHSNRRVISTRRFKLSRNLSSLASLVLRPTDEPPSLPFPLEKRWMEEEEEEEKEETYLLLALV